MTTPTSTTTPVVTPTALLAGAEGAFELAAVQLLISHGRWIEREAFTDCCTTTTGVDGEPVAAVQWGKVAVLLNGRWSGHSSTAEAQAQWDKVIARPADDRDTIGSPSSWVVLRTAHAIATDALNWRKLDQSNREHVLTAVTIALAEYLT